jgi:hypothetical protein
VRRSRDRQEGFANDEVVQINISILPQGDVRPIRSRLRRDLNVDAAVLSARQQFLGVRQGG